MKEYLKRATSYTLMNDYFYVQNANSAEDDSSK